MLQKRAGLPSARAAFAACRGWVCNGGTAVSLRLDDKKVFVGLQVCGCHAEGFGVDLGDNDADDAAMVLGWVRDGLRVVYVDLPTARSTPLGPDCGKRTSDGSAGSP